MKFDIVTLFPELIESACNHSIIKRAIESNIIELETTNPRDYTKDKHNKVDDTPYGGGAGMVLSPQPFIDAINSIKTENNCEKIILTPQGTPFCHKIATELAAKEQLIIICGHYEGFDERIRKSSNAKEISIGDFVLTGGEYPALCIIDSITRLKEGALGTDESSQYDSFADGLLEHPHYTKPREYKEMKVPEVLLSGNHAEINKWRRLQQLINTKEKRPDLYEKFLKTEISNFDKKLIKENNLLSK